MFEMVDGLRVNFHKSSIMGLNVEPEELNIASYGFYIVGQVVCLLTSLGYR